MSTNRIVWGLKIYLPEAATPNPSIGLYTDGGVSTFRWIETYLENLSDAWAYNIIKENGIPAIVEGSESIRGGTTATVNSISATIDNTEQFNDIIETASIYLGSLKCEVIEFSQAVATGVVTETVRYRGVTQVRDWNPARFVIPIEPAIHNRRAQILTDINIESFPNADSDAIGTTVPATFGKYFTNQASGVVRYAQMVQTANKADNKSGGDLVTIFNDSGGTVTSATAEVNARESYAIVGADEAPTREYVLEIAKFGDIDIDTLASFDPGDLYLYVLEDEAVEGVYRRIESIEKHHTSRVRITVEAFFTTDLSYRTSVVETDVVSAVTAGDSTIQVLSVSGFEVGDYCKIYSAGDWEINEITALGTGAPNTITLQEPVLYNYSISDVVERVDQGNGAWCNIVEVDKEFQIDAWKMDSFLDADNEEVDSTVNSPAVDIYSYNQQQSVDVSGEAETAIVETAASQYTRLPQFAYTIESGDSDNNRLVITPKLYEKSLDSMASYIMLPMQSLGLYGGDADIVGIDSPSGNSWIKRQEGIYTDGTLNSISSVSNPDLNNAVDRLVATVGQLSFTAQSTSTGNNDILLVYECVLPAIAKNFTWSDVYLGVHMNMSVTNPVTVSSTPLLDCIVTKSRWLGYADEIDNVRFFNTALGSGASGTGNVRNLPDFFFDDSLNSKDQYFYVEDTTAPDISGFTLYPLGVGTFEKYENVYRLFFAIQVSGTWDNTEDYDFVYDLAEINTMFKNNIAVKKNLYTFVRGRIFDDTWGGRKTAADMIEKPIDQFEHFCRLQNWSEEGDTSVEYGKEYSSSALINTGTGDGGFGSTTLSDLGDRKFSFQIIKPDEGWSDVVKRRMCRAMWCVNYQNEDGEESLSYLPKLESGITDTVDYGDVPNGMQIGEVKEPDPKNVFAEPFVRYNFNPASGKFDGLIGIKQVQRGTWDASYTPGFNGSEGEYFYDWCHDNLWKRYRQVEPPPADMTDQYYISEYDDAKWFLTQWLDWMLVRRINVPVYYEKANSWHVGKHIYLNLPHQTDGDNKEAVIEKIVKDKNGGICMLSLAYWITDLPADDFYKNFVYYTASEGADEDWDMVYDLQGGDNDKNFVY